MASVRDRRRRSSGLSRLPGVGPFRACGSQGVQWARDLWGSGFMDDGVQGTLMEDACLAFRVWGLLDYGWVGWLNLVARGFQGL